MFEQDRIPWLHSIRRTAILLTSETGLAALASPAPANDDGIEASHELASVLNKVHPSTLGHGDQMAARSRKAVVVGCSALKRSYRDLLRGRESRYVIEGVEKVEPQAEDQNLETFFVYRE